MFLPEGVDAVPKPSDGEVESFEVRSSFSQPVEQG
jgi:hypothetical protein